MLLRNLSQSSVAKNISFTKLGEEECEECLLHEQHEHACDDEVMDCLQCERWRKHKNFALQNRLAYQADAEKDWQGDTSVRSVDLQKVIMLPRMLGVKTAIFTWRIVAYHETNASVGKKGNKNTPSLWSGMGAWRAEVLKK